MQPESLHDLKGRVTEIGTVKTPKKGGQLRSELTLTNYTEAVENHAAALLAHTLVLNKVTAVTDIQLRSQVRAILAEEWGRRPASDVDDSDSLTDYIGGGSGAVSAYASVLNKLFPGLNINNADMTGVTKVGQMISLIISHLPNGG